MNEYTKKFLEKGPVDKELERIKSEMSIDVLLEYLKRRVGSCYKSDNPIEDIQDMLSDMIEHYHEQDFADLDFFFEIE
mgnify:CR=1 FL=1